MTESRIVKRIQADVNNSIQELYEKKLVRDYRGLSVKRTGKLDYNISYSGKDTKISNIIYDKHISADKIIDALLKGYQYNILLYNHSLP